MHMSLGKRTRMGHPQHGCARRAVPIAVAPHPRRAWRRLPLLALALACAFSQTGRAATYYWDTNSTTAGFGTASGTWGSDQLWSTSSAGTLLPTVTNTLVADLVNFGNGATGLGTGTISLTGTSQAFTTMTFAAGSGAITIDGTAGTLLTMGAASTITVNNAADTINTQLVGGATSLTKSGTGRLTLSGLSATAANNYAGTTILNGGILAISNTAGLTGGLTFNATPVTLDLSGGSASFAGTMTVQTNSTTDTSRITIGDGQTLTTTGAVSIGNGNTTDTTRLTVAGSGTAKWSVNAPNTLFRVGGGTTTVLDMVSAHHSQP